MFMVGGGILGHGLPFVHALSHHAATAAGPVLGAVVSGALDVAVGLIAGALALAAVTVAGKVLRAIRK